MKKGNAYSIRMMSYITDALLLLMKSKSYYSISITELTNKAGVDRNTYYRHFGSKEDIIRYFYELLMEEFIHAYQSAGTADQRTFFSILFQTFYHHREQLLLIHRTGLSALLLDALHEMAHYDDKKKTVSPEQLYRLGFQLGDIHSSLLGWFEQGMQIPPGKMTFHYLRLHQNFPPWMQDAWKQFL